MRPRGSSLPLFLLLWWTSRVTRDCFQNLLLSRMIAQAPYQASMASLETFTSATTQLRDGEGSGQDHQDLTVLCLAPHAGLWSESGTGGSASWWGVGFLWSMAQVQIEFVFLFQPASLSHPPMAPPVKEERHFSLI